MARKTKDAPLVTKPQDVRERFVRLPEVLRTAGLTKPTLYRRIKNGEFPAPKRISIRAVGWLESDIDAWINSREAA